jgi:DNA mismatch repair protein PMS2
MNSNNTHSTLFRYETLQKSTTLHQQPLFHPLQIDSTPSEEMLIIEYLECFQLNGFSIHIDENAPIGKKLTLRAIPFRYFF